MKVTLIQLRAFIVVSREGSFTRAAEVLGTSQPSISTAIQQLENALELKLFDRSTKTLRLTKASRSFLPVIERLVNELDVTVADLHSIAEGTAGNVAVAVLPSIATNILPKTIASFSKTFPNIRIALRDDNSSGVQERVRNGEVDLGVAGRIEHSEGLHFEPMIRDPFGVVLHKTHPLALEKGPINWEELSGYPFISFAADTGIRPLLDTLEHVPENIALPWIEVSNIATVLSLLNTNLGIAALPEMAVSSMTSEVIFRTLLNPPLFRELGLITRTDRSLSPAASHFVDHMKKAMLPQWLQ